MLAGTAGEDEVVGLVEGGGDGLPFLVVRGGAGGLEQLGDGTVGRGDGGPLGRGAAQGPAEQGEEEHEQPAEAEQQGRLPPGLGHGEPGPDDGVEEQEQPGDGGDGADRGDHPRDERDEREHGDGDPAVPEDEGPEGDSDGAEELRHGDVEDAHPVGVGGVADDAGERAHRHERPVGGLPDGQPDGERRGQGDGGAGDGGPGDRGGGGLEPGGEPGGRGETRGP